MDFEMAEKIRDVSQMSIIDDEIMLKARNIVAGVADGVGFKELSDLLFDYSCSLAASVATGVSYVCLGADNFHEMAESVETNQAEQLVKDIEAWLN